MARSQEQIETILKTLSPNPELIYYVLIAYGFPKSTVTRIKSGDYNQSKEPGQIIWKKQLCYQEVLPGTSLSALQDMRASKAIMKHRPRFLVVSDGDNWAALDTKVEETREFPMSDLYKHCDFFLPWTGREKAKFYEEKVADINAARKMGKLFDAIKADNPGFDEHALNVFMARLLFCFFAEDSGILPEDQMFTDLLEETTLEDGSDMAEVFARVFRIMICRRMHLREKTCLFVIPFSLTSTAAYLLMMSRFLPFPENRETRYSLPGIRIGLRLTPIFSVICSKPVKTQQNAKNWENTILQYPIS